MITSRAKKKRGTTVYSRHNLSDNRNWPIHGVKNHDIMLLWYSWNKTHTFYRKMINLRVGTVSLLLIRCSTSPSTFLICFVFIILMFRNTVWLAEPPTNMIGCVGLLGDQPSVPGGNKIWKCNTDTSSPGSVASGRQIENNCLGRTVLLNLWCHDVLNYTAILDVLFL